MKTKAITIPMLLLAATLAGAVENDAVTFTRDVAPIFAESCMTCHRPGEIAPMSLLSYEESRPWARSIKREVMSGAMPPWHADPAYGYVYLLTSGEGRISYRRVDARALLLQGARTDVPVLADQTVFVASAHDRRINRRLLKMLGIKP